MSIFNGKTESLVEYENKAALNYFMLVHAPDLDDETIIFGKSKEENIKEHKKLVKKLKALLEMYYALKGEHAEHPKKQLKLTKDWYELMFGLRFGSELNLDLIENRIVSNYQDLISTMNENE